MSSVPSGRPFGDALRRVRERRGDALRAAATGASLPVRYIAAFESERPHLVFRSRARAEAFLAEYARYLGLDPIRVVRAFRARHPLPEARPDSGAPALVEAVPRSGGTAGPRRRAGAPTVAARRRA
ncbi:MAG: helix-turn-helix domain-containing protein, partial [Actinobacteria bacterium]|nr:helix-turn-helix domain-containing protein [Actinomycetota bacterium]